MHREKNTEIERVRVLNVPVDTVRMSSAIQYIDGLIEQDSRGNYILAVNPEKVHVLNRDSLLKEMFESAALLLPDGIGVVLALWILFGKKIRRVSGADLMQHLCKHASIKGYRIFVFGSKEEVNRQAVDTLLKTYPGIQIVGRCNGYIGEDGMDGLLHAINNSRADILFIALGSPKQEQWIRKYLPLLTVKICQGIGGTLDTIAGNVKRAPTFLQNVGLEWFYRLITDPRRIRRQIVLPIFAFNVLKEKFLGKD